MKVRQKIAIYARVSTANNGQDPMVQVRELRDIASTRLKIASEYVDVEFPARRRNGRNSTGSPLTLTGADRLCRRLEVRIGLPGQ